MKRSDAKYAVNNGYDSSQQINTISGFQAAESLNEIAQFTVRDRFAQSAMNAMIETWPTATPDKIAERAYQFADAMLQARVK